MAFNRAKRQHRAHALRGNLVHAVVPAHGLGDLAGQRRAGPARLADMADRVAGQPKARALQRHIGQHAVETSDGVAHLAEARAPGHDRRRHPEPTDGADATRRSKGESVRCAACRRSRTRVGRWRIPQPRGSSARPALAPAPPRSNSGPSCHEKFRRSGGADYRLSLPKQHGIR